MPSTCSHFLLERRSDATVIRLRSQDGTNRLTRACVMSLSESIQDLLSARRPQPLIITGNQNFFSAGADLAEISTFNGPEGYEFSLMGQHLMNLIQRFPAPVYAVIHGYCMGGGLDLALACHCRIASPHAMFGHRGTALGLVTGWGGTQRLPRVIGRTRALQIFVAAEKLHAAEALKIGLIDEIDPDPLRASVRKLRQNPRT